MNKNDVQEGRRHQNAQKPYWHWYPSFSTGPGGMMMLGPPDRFLPRGTEAVTAEQKSAAAGMFPAKSSSLLPVA